MAIAITNRKCSQDHSNSSLQGNHNLVVSRTKVKKQKYKLKLVFMSHVSLAKVLRTCKSHTWGGGGSSGLGTGQL